MDKVISTIFTIIATVVSGIILFILTRFLSKQEIKEKQDLSIKEEETAIILEFLNALGKLSVANCVALRDGKTNGEINTALSTFEDADKKLYEYLVRTHSQMYK